jgi:hypothetical protein
MKRLPQIWIEQKGQTIAMWFDVKRDNSRISMLENLSVVSKMEPWNYFGTIFYTGYSTWPWLRGTRHLSSIIPYRLRTTTAKSNLIWQRYSKSIFSFSCQLSNILCNNDLSTLPHLNAIVRPQFRLLRRWTSDLRLSRHRWNRQFAESLQTNSCTDQLTQSVEIFDRKDYRNLIGKNISDWDQKNIADSDRRISFPGSSVEQEKSEYYIERL